MRWVTVDRFFAAVIDRQLLEIAQQADGDLSGPGVAPDLERRLRIGLDGSRGLFSLQEEMDVAAGLEGVISCLSLAFPLHRPLVNYLAIFFRVILAVGEVPTQRLEQWVEEIAPQLGFVVMPGAVGGALASETVNQVDDFLRRADGRFVFGHFFCPRI